MNPIDIRIGLLLQNARQMLNIVQQAFPGLLLSEAETLKDCARAKSTGEMLDCLWSNAASLVNVPGPINTAAALHALTLVCKRLSPLKFDC